MRSKHGRAMALGVPAEVVDGEAGKSVWPPVAEVDQQQQQTVAL